MREPPPAIALIAPAIKAAVARINKLRTDVGTEAPNTEVRLLSKRKRFMITLCCLKVSKVQTSVA